MKTFNKICKECGKDFVTKNVRKIYCSNLCNQKHFRKTGAKEYNLICLFCNKEFKSKLKKVRFCSISCAGKYKNKEGIKVEFNCKRCGTVFIQKHKRHFYCSNACKVLDGTENTPMEDVACSNCGEIISRIKSLVKRKKNFFCSVICESEFREREADDFRICENCKKEFKCKKHDKLIFCSIGCQGKWQSEYRSGKNHPSYKHDVPDEKRIKKCKFCQKEMILQPREYETQIYCNRTCSILGNDKSMTLPHRTIAKFLMENYFEIEHEYLVGRYSADIRFKNTPLIIEINGTYWHSDVRFYKKPEREERVSGIKTDKRKKKALLKKGFKILYIWEHDVTNNLKTCEELIFKFIENNGVLLNYHSLNYSLIENNLILNNILLIPHAER